MQSANAENWFVSANFGANSPSNGSVVQPFKTISYALKFTAPNDTVYVLPGRYDWNNDAASGIDSSDYDSFGIEIPHDNLTIIGLTAALTSPSIPSSLDEYLFQGEAFWESEFPTIVGQSRAFIQGNIVFKNGEFVQINHSNMAIGTGMFSNGRSGVSISGLQIKSFHRGIRVLNGSGNSFSNLLLNGFGEPRLVPEVDGGNLPTGNQYLLDYVGHGLTMRDSFGSSAEDCFLLDAEAEGYSLIGSSMRLTRCQAYSTRWFGTTVESAIAVGAIKSSRAYGMDYPFVISTSSTFGATGNIIEDSTTERLESPYNGKLLYTGHGFAVVSNATNQEATSNTIRRCDSESWGFNFQVRGFRTHANRFEDCYAHRGTRGFAYSSGADDNEFARCECFNVTSAITSVGPVAGWIPPPGADSVCEGNTFFNCRLHAWNEAFSNNNPPSNHSVVNSRFFNCTFNGYWTGDYTELVFGRRADFFDTVTTNAKHEFVSCIITNFVNYKPTTTTASINATFRSCCIFHNVGFDLPSHMDGASILQCKWEDPFLVQAITDNNLVNNLDYHINLFGTGNNVSAAFDAGISDIELLADYDVVYFGDIDGRTTAFGGTYDIGCDEHTPN